MTENKEIKKGKKTLSLKLGSKPIISNKRGIEAGKTVIVEKKRYKRNTSTDQKSEQASLNKKEVTNTSNVAEDTITDKKSRSGVIMKPHTKDEQKKMISEYLSQQKILIFTNNPVGTAKVCKKFEKDSKKLSAEVAFFDNQLYTKDDIAKVATLPSLEEIRGKIVGLINAPASKIVRLLQRPDQDIISILQNKKD